MRDFVDNALHTVTMFSRFPHIIALREPSKSIEKMQVNCNTAFSSLVSPLSSLLPSLLYLLSSLALLALRMPYTKPRGPVVFA